nr:MAG: hypothetical protein [Bacteriophage sp.]
MMKMVLVIKVMAMMKRKKIKVMNMVKMMLKIIVKMMLNMKVEEMVLKIVYIGVLMRLVSITTGHVKLD